MDHSQSKSVITMLNRHEEVLSCEVLFKPSGAWAKERAQELSLTFRHVKQETTASSSIMDNFEGMHRNVKELR